MLARELAPRSISDTLMVCVIRAPIIAICVYLILVTIISAMFYVPPPYNPQDIDATTKAEIILPLVLAIISTAPLFVANLRARIVERATLVALSRHGGPQSIVTVFSRMGVHRVTHKPARLALETVIRAVNESWYGRLPQGSERVLIKLAGSGDEELAFDALNAIAKAGGGGAVEFITRLARGAARETVRVRASEVLPILLARKEWEDEPSILLRPTAYPDQHLLLPLQEITPCSNQLLRADSYQSRDIDDIVGPREAARHKY